MDPLPAFAFTLLAISFTGIRWRVPPFFNLIGGALFFGVLTGMDPDQLVTVIMNGLGRIFALFALIILSGAIIASTLQEQGYIDCIVGDIRKRAKNPYAISGVAGYLLALPVACSVTAFIILTPVLKGLGGSGVRPRILLGCAAIGSLVSFGLVYPAPAVIPLVQTLTPTLSPAYYNAFAIPLSLVILILLILSYPRWTRSADGGEEGEGGSGDPAHGASLQQEFSLRPYAPFVAILLAIPAGWMLGLSPGALIQVIMLAGAVTALLLAAPGARVAGLQRGTKHAGIIIFDICGAGALAGVIIASGLPDAALGGITGFLPLLLVPFVLAALIQTAQGSRVVTAVLSAGILAGTTVAGAIHPVALVLMVAAGCFIFSFVTDPYFWIISRATGADIPAMLKYYTIPLALCGVAIYIAAVGMQIAATRL